MPGFFTSVTRPTRPLAVNAFTESLALELAPFNIRLSLVMPGAKKSRTT